MPPFDPGEISGYPTGPGCYLMKDQAGAVIYVGKAKNVRARLRSYFSGADSRLSVQFILRRIATIETIVTRTEKEAFLLENTLIKKHKPRYNVQLRDDKTYFSIRLDGEAEWPRIELVRRRSRRRGDRARYFGPFASAKAVRETIEHLLRIFPLRSCKDSEFRNRSRPCILHEVGKCCAPCALEVDRAEYARLVREVSLFLEGRRDEVVEGLQRRMAEFAAALDYENAALLRDRLRAVEATREKQLVVQHHGDDRDAIALATDEGAHLVVAQRYRRGVLTESRRYKFRDVGQEPGRVLAEFLMRYYDGERPIPAEVLLSEAPEDATLLEEALRERRAGAVRLRVPARGKPRREMDLARANAQEQLKKTIAGERDVRRTLETLQKALKLARPPEVIECVDVSNIQGMLAVGSLVRFVNGEADKAGYRRFKIGTVRGADDYAMMREVLERRYRRLLKERRELPDLLILDGGKGQLNVAVDVMRGLGVCSVALTGLAKSRLKDAPDGGEKTRTDERLFLPNRKNPVVLRPGSPALHLVRRIRDEAHRFAVTYHRQLRRRSNLKSILDEIPGVGPTRRRRLLRHFGGLAKIRAATAEELAAVPGVTRAVAEGLYAFFHPDVDWSDGRR